MKFFATLFTLLIPFFASANMASPILDGTWGAFPFINRYASITQEQMLIVIDEHFTSADYQISYHIKVSQGGKQVPLLFYASEYSQGFKVWVDGAEVELLELPLGYQNIESGSFAGFDALYDTDTRGIISKTNVESPLGSFGITPNDLKFFEVDLSEGEHIIRVEYTAEAWVDRSEWLKKSTLRYALAPARYWKSFGSLELTIDASKFKGTYSANIGKPNQGDLRRQATWNFNSLPVDILELYYEPKASEGVQWLIDFSPTYIAVLLSIPFIIFHLIIVGFGQSKRGAKPYKLLRLVGEIGTFAMPLIGVACYMYSYEIIDQMIGIDASRFHGYTFLVVIYYPIILLIYWMVVQTFMFGLRKFRSEKSNLKSNANRPK